MKKILSMVLIFALLLNSCMYVPNGEYPFDYPAAMWVSEEPDIWFEVTDTTGRSDAKGELTIGDEVYEIVMSFSYSYSVVVINGYDSVYSDKRNWLFRGRCKFGAEKLIVKIDKDEKFPDIFNGEVDEITFIRIPIEEYEEVSSESVSLKL